MKYFLLFCSIAIITSCKQNSNGESEPIKHQVSDSIIYIDNPILTAKIKTIKLSAEPYQKKIITSGIVKAIPNNYAEIASPFSGRIIKSFVCLGQKVNIGSPVFEISSPEFFETGKTYYQTKQEMQLSEKNLKRQQDLLNNGVGAQKELEEAEVNYELSKRDFENSVASLKVYHVNPDELVLGQPLIVRSPIKGEIVENNIVIGQYLREDAEPVAIVAELSKVWVIGQVKEKDIKSVPRSANVEIRLTGMTETPLKGEVFHIGEILDESTRSVQVYILCDNSERIMKPGMFVTATFSESNGNTILIPAGSLFQMEENSYVFVCLGENKFLKRKVQVDGTDSDRVIIKAGLNPSDEIVTEGGSLLMEIRN